MQRRLWWQTGVIYQIYPRSFQDSNDDGIGDLRGITQRLPYLVELGVDAIWLSPIFPSPMADFGYDISDYTGIDPLFGSLDDFDALLAAAHAQGLKVILDLVPNHTSDRHPCFLESRASRRSRKRDWYIWRNPAANGGPPNNWLSVFGGSAWEYDGASGQYYYHAFLAAQPDLNWRNLAVRSAIYEVMRYWFRRGVDGFRVDAVWHLIKDGEFRDNPPNAGFRATDPPHHRLVPLTRSISRRCTTSSPKCGAWQTNFPIACSSAKSICRSRGWSRITAAISPECTFRSISACSARPGAPPRLPD